MEGLSAFALLFERPQIRNADRGSDARLEFSIQSFTTPCSSDRTPTLSPTPALSEPPFSSNGGNAFPKVVLVHARLLLWAPS